MIQLVRELTASDPASRGLAADGATDVVGALDAGQALAVAQVLVWLAVDEEDSVALESQLNALAELASNDLLRHLDRDSRGKVPGELVAVQRLGE